MVTSMARFCMVAHRIWQAPNLQQVRLYAILSMLEGVSFLKEEFFLLSCSIRDRNNDFIILIFNMDMRQPVLFVIHEIHIDD
jgi:hypothetical protein